MIPKINTLLEITQRKQRLNTEHFSCNLQTAFVICLRCK